MVNVNGRGAARQDQRDETAPRLMEKWVGRAAPREGGGRARTTRRWRWGRGWRAVRVGPTVWAVAGAAMCLGGVTKRPHVKRVWRAPRAGRGGLGLGGPWQNYRIKTVEFEDECITSIRDESLRSVSPRNYGNGETARGGPTSRSGTHRRGGQPVSPCRSEAPAGGNAGPADGLASRSSSSLRVRGTGLPPRGAAPCACRCSTRTG